MNSATRNALEQLLAGVADPLERLRLIEVARAGLADDRLPTVRDALENHGWDAIADATSLQPAAAKWRWQGTDEDIAARHEQGRKRSERPSSVPTDLPGLSVSEAAKRLNVSAQAIYLRVSRGQLRSETVDRAGRSYKRVFPEE